MRGAAGALRGGATCCAAPSPGQCLPEQVRDAAQRAEVTEGWSGLRRSSQPHPAAWQCDPPARSCPWRGPPSAAPGDLGWSWGPRPPLRGALHVTGLPVSHWQQGLGTERGGEGALGPRGTTARGHAWQAAEPQRPCRNCMLESPCQELPFLCSKEGLQASEAWSAALSAARTRLQGLWVLGVKHPAREGRMLSAGPLRGHAAQEHG